MKILKNKKAVSPVISVVLLIGIAVAASALVYAWYAGMQKGTQEATGETAARTAQATSAAILITNVEYSSSTGINVTVTNIGSVNVTGLNLYVNNTLVKLDSKCITYVDVDSSTNLWNGSAFTLSSGVHTVKVTSQQGAQASQTLVI